ncbi:hypothetical protein ACLKA6_002845 [Drosophila palustris]
MQDAARKDGTGTSRAQGFSGRQFCHVPSKFINCDSYDNQTQKLPQNLAQNLCATKAHSGLAKRGLEIKKQKLQILRAEERAGDERTKKLKQKLKLMPDADAEPKSTTWLVGKVQ